MELLFVTLNGVFTGPRMEDSPGFNGTQVTEAVAWGANVSGSLIIEDDDAPDRMTVFMVPVATWSDGAFDSN